MLNEPEKERLRRGSWVDAYQVSLYWLSTRSSSNLRWFRVVEVIE